MNRLPDTERGSILVWTAVILAVLIAFAGLATDIPYLYVAKRQAQTAADAGALAGAYGLLSGTATQDALSFAGKTPIIGTLLTDPQITVFTCNSNGGAIGECTGSNADPDQVTTITHRDVAHGNPMPLFVMPILQIFGLGVATETSSGSDAANVSATATARIFNTCSGRCFKPWAIPDRWTDTNGNGEYDPGEPYDRVGTGYNFDNPADKGIQLTLKIGNATPGETITPGFYYCIDFPPLNRTDLGSPITGGDEYRENIATCGEKSVVSLGDLLQHEPGGKTGPTAQGVQALIDADPTAVWDEGCDCVRQGAGGPVITTSPRLIPIALFDPRLPVESGRNYVTVTNVGGFFLEDIGIGNSVIGRLAQVILPEGTLDPTCTGLKTVQMVK